MGRGSRYPLRMNILRRTPIERIIRRLERHPAAVVTAASLSMRFSRDYRRVRTGDIDHAEFGRRGVSHFGSVGGGMAGAAAGAWAGTLIAPGLGTILGAFAGSVAGDEAGQRFSRAALEHAEVRVGRRWSAPNGAEPEPGASEARPQTPSLSSRRKL